MKRIIFLITLLCIMTSSCTSHTSIVNEIGTNTNTPTLIVNKTKIDLSHELYLDENSSPDNLQGEQYQQEYSYFSNLHGNGVIYQFSDEKWITALTWSRVIPFDNLDHVSSELRQHYIQVWRDGELLYFFPVNGIGYKLERLLRYGDHWIFWFTDLNTNQGLIVQDGVLLNDLYDYDSAFSIFLLDGKPFFFFQQGSQLGISYDNQEIPLPYSNISYGLICCEDGGKGRWNPRGTNVMVGFYTQIGETEYQYIEIGLK